MDDLDLDWCKSSASASTCMCVYERFIDDSLAIRSLAAHVRMRKRFLASRDSASRRACGKQTGGLIFWRFGDRRDRGSISARDNRPSDRKNYATPRISAAPSRRGTHVRAEPRANIAVHYAIFARQVMRGLFPSQIPFLCIEGIPRWN